MLIRKIKYKLSKVSKGFLKRTNKIEIDLGYWFFSSICLLSIILLSINIFRIIKKGYGRYEIIQGEKERLEKLLERNAELKEDLKYYSSKEYIDVKAREELNLAFPDQRLVYIEKQEDLYIDNDTDGQRQESLKPDWRLWYDLIF